jgi:beta-N-acetylhexosaminidase
MTNIFTILFKTLALIILLLMFSTGCNREKNIQTSHGTWAGTVFPTMNDAQKLGQTLCLPVDPIGYFLLPDYREKVQNFIRKCEPGAVYFSSDMVYWKPKLVLDFNAGKLREVVYGIQKISPVPILFAADFESGAWNWDKDATHFPSPMALGAAGSFDMAYREGKIIGLEAKVQGINWILAPFGNIVQNSDPFNFSIDCFGSDVQKVSEFSTRFIKGCQESGVATCLKYFPGPGRHMDETDPDTFAPFKSGISAGVFSIMGNPFTLTGEENTLSQIPLKNYLEKLFRFNGPVVRKIISDNKDTSENIQAGALVQSYVSGNDMVILPDDIDRTASLVDLLITQSRLGKMEMRSINASALKIMKMKDALKLKIQDGNLSSIVTGIGIDEYRRTAMEIVKSSITILRNDDSVVPLDFNKQYILFLHFIDAQSLQDATVFADKVESVCPEAKQVTILHEPDKRIIQEVLRRSVEADAVVCTFFINPASGIDASRIPKEYANLVHKALQQNRKTVGVSFFSPFLINDLPELKSFLAFYSLSDLSMDAALEVLSGKIGASGKLPIDISDRYPAGYGLDLKVNTIEK